MCHGRAKHPRLCLLIAVLLAGAGIFLGSSARAQEAVDDRLDRLERNLSQLQRQVDHTDASPGDASAPPADGSPAPAGGSQALNTQVRLDTLDAQMRQLTGQLEEVQFGISQLKDRLDKMQKDNEQRFQALEHPGGGAPIAGAPTTLSAPPDGAAPPQPAQDGGDTSQSGDQPQYSGGSGFLVAPPSAGAPHANAPTGASQNLEDLAVPPASGPAGDPPDVPAGNAQQQYGAAFNLLRQSKYDAAERGFRGFLQAHPKDPLAGNAQYWLGDIYFVRKQYDKAAPLFAEGYQKYPHSPKAADNLLKLGISLGNSGNKAAACAAFGRLERDYPNAPGPVKANERGEKRRLKCG